MERTKTSWVSKRGTVTDENAKILVEELKTKKIVQEELTKILYQKRNKSLRVSEDIVVMFLNEVIPFEILERHKQ